jgi:pyridoxamine 5'-phosphate oxidase
VDLDDLDTDPHAQFERWFAEAAEAPSVRMVLLKGHDERGFVFYTNRESRKGSEIEANPRAAIVLYWEPQSRQVRVEGAVERVSDGESFAYFRTRPRPSRISAWASPQSRPLVDRAELEQRAAEIEIRFAGEDDVPLPPFWGGYRVVATAIEFWQGRQDRLHDRVRYELRDGAWRRERLGP